MAFALLQTDAVTLNSSVNPVKSSEHDAATELLPDKISPNLRYSITCT
jgi:hypothetical protein